MHRTWRLVVVVVIVVGGCSDARPATGSTSGDPPRCQALEDQIVAALAMPGGSCNADADCVLVGGQRGPQTCNCAPFVLECGGMPVPANAPGLSSARTLIRQFFDSGCMTDTACDCGPNGPVRCSADHRCTAAIQSCNPLPPDAAVDAAPDAWSRFQ